MKKLSKTVAIVSAILVVANIALINYSDFSWKQNAGSYTGIVAMSLVAGSAYLSYKKEKKEADEKR